tara:strand:+ start:118 stop:465 length:348 start_codon:yes stop_codon:yes gene_type:complete
MKFYDNPQCISVEDYQTDMKRFKYIKRLLNQYNSSTDLKIRLLLNHIIMVYNLFDNQIATRILFFKIDPKYWPILKPILIFLKLMPDMIRGIDGNNIRSSDIQLHNLTVTQLREI